MRLAKEGFFVFDGSAEMTDAKPPHLGIAGKSGSLKSCGVLRLLCPQSSLMEVGGFVIKQVDALDDILQLWQINGVGAISIGARRRGRRGKAFVRNDGAVLGRPRSTRLDVVYLADGNPIGIYHLPSDMRQVRLLAEKIAGSGKPMLQRNAVNSDASVFIDKGVPAGIDRMEEHRVPDFCIVGALQEVEQFTQLLWPVDM